MSNIEDQLRALLRDEKEEIPKSVLVLCALIDRRLTKQGGSISTLFHILEEQGLYDARDYL